MSAESVELAHALKAVTDLTPKVTRGVVNAARGSKPLTWRQAELQKSILNARALLVELLLSQVRLGWHGRGDDAA